MIVVTLGTDEHRWVEERMAAQLARCRAGFDETYRKYLNKEEEDERDAAA